MLRSALVWMGFAPDPAFAHTSDAHPHGHSHGDDYHGHAHGVIDPTIASTTEGIWAIKWSFVILIATTLAQLVVVYYTGSVALFADTIHNFGDATTAIPLWIAFLFAQRAPSATFNYGLNRVEDLAGVVIVGLILFSAIVAGYTAVDRLINPREISFIGAVAVAGMIGFIGNETVAVFRIRVGRRINSAALIADGYHARVDGFGSLAVVAGALGVWLGFPLADPIVGLVITALIVGIVWQSATAVFRRMLDGVEPGLVEAIRKISHHVPGIIEITDVKARWLGHKLRAEIVLSVDPDLSLSMADEVAMSYERELKDHLPALQGAHIRIRPVGTNG